MSENHPEMDQLQQLVSTLNLTEAGLQSLAYRLSPQQRRLFELIAEKGEVDTITVRNQASIGNVSAVAIELNAKLEAVGDPRRVLCHLVDHSNKFGEKGVIGRWRFVSVEAANDAQNLEAAAR